MLVFTILDMNHHMRTWNNIFRGQTWSWKWCGFHVDSQVSYSWIWSEIRRYTSWTITLTHPTDCHWIGFHTFAFGTSLGYRFNHTRNWGKREHSMNSNRERETYVQVNRAHTVVHNLIECYAISCNVRCHYKVVFSSFGEVYMTGILMKSCVFLAVTWVIFKSNWKTLAITISVEIFEVFITGFYPLWR